jgi:succinyl-diaminopimelate desuccinylase
MSDWFPTEDEDWDLRLPPKYTVTSIRGGSPGSFSVVPDACTMELDVRLTQTHDAAWAAEFVQKIVNTCDTYYPTLRSTTIEPVGDPWPAYRLDADHPMVQALRAGTRSAGLDPVPTVAGPSNIGCYLAQHGIPATAGFGVNYRGLHAANEAIEVSSIPAVYASYYEAVRGLLG